LIDSPDYAEELPVLSSTYDSKVPPWTEIESRANIGDPTNVGSSTSQTSFEELMGTLAINMLPTENIDYLCHAWSHEDAWASLMYLHLSRDYDDRKKARLQNAIWRGWEKNRLRLGTVSPESVNW
jgi:hypothetical protein